MMAWINCDCGLGVLQCSLVDGVLLDLEDMGSVYSFLIDLYDSWIHHFTCTLCFPFLPFPVLPIQIVNPLGMVCLV